MVLSPPRCHGLRRISGKSTCTSVAIVKVLSIGRLLARDSTFSGSAQLHRRLAHLFPLSADTTLGAVLAPRTLISVREARCRARRTSPYVSCWPPTGGRPFQSPGTAPVLDFSGTFAHGSRVDRSARAAASALRAAFGLAHAPPARRCPISYFLSTPRALHRTNSMTMVSSDAREPSISQASAALEPPGDLRGRPRCEPQLSLATCQRQLGIAGQPTRLRPQRPLPGARVRLRGASYALRPPWRATSRLLTVEAGVQAGRDPANQIDPQRSSAKSLRAHPAPAPPHSACVLPAQFPALPEFNLLTR